MDGRIDLLATATFDKKLTAFPVVLSVLVIAIDTQAAPGGAVTQLTVTFAVDKEQAAVIALAQAKKCPLMVLLRGPGDDKTDGYDIKKVVEMLTTLTVPKPVVAPAPRAK